MSELEGLLDKTIRATISSTDKTYVGRVIREEKSQGAVIWVVMQAGKNYHANRWVGRHDKIEVLETTAATEIKEETK